MVRKSIVQRGDRSFADFEQFVVGRIAHLEFAAVKLGNQAVDLLWLDWGGGFDSLLNKGDGFCR
jgi:hypothetical protein